MKALLAVVLFFSVAAQAETFNQPILTQADKIIADVMHEAMPLDEVNTEVNQNHDNIIYQNLCGRTIYAALVFKNLNDTWEKGMWYKMAYQRRGVAGKTRNRIYYIYAQTENGDLVWKGSDLNVEHNGRNYGFLAKRITTDEWGNWTQNFTCN